MTENEVREKYRSLTETLIRKKYTVTAMESCTGGLIASLITDTEGASAVLRGSYVTYSNFAKEMAGVPQETIARFGVYSRETARDMASTCRRAFGADIGVGVTGSFSNPDPANPDSVPGQVWCAVDFRGILHDRRFTVDPSLDRHAAKMYAAGEVYDLIMSLQGMK